MLCSGTFLSATTFMEGRCMALYTHPPLPAPTSHSSRNVPPCPFLPRPLALPFSSRAGADLDLRRAGVEALGSGVRGVL